MPQDETKDINEIKPSRPNDRWTMPTDHLECVSRVEQVNGSREDAETSATGGNFKA
jgi:hypothetical protein